MDGCDDLRLRKLPDVQLVHGKHALYVKNIVADLVERDLGRNTLEQDERCAADYDTISIRLDDRTSRDLPSGKAEWKIITVMTKLMIGSK